MIFNLKFCTQPTLSKCGTYWDIQFLKNVTTYIESFVLWEINLIQEHYQVSYSKGHETERLTDHILKLITQYLKSI